MVSDANGFKVFYNYHLFAVSFMFWFLLKIALEKNVFLYKFQITESDTMEATAQFDFSARSNRELSLRKGDHVTLRKQVSNDWWQGTVKGKDGLVPDKYISLKIK